MVQGVAIIKGDVYADLGVGRGINQFQRHRKQPLPVPALVKEVAGGIKDTGDGKLCPFEAIYLNGQ